MKHISDSIADLCVLPNDQLLAANYGNVVIYDENFKEIKTISEINNKPICSTSVTINELNQIYICDFIAKTDKSQVILTDLDFKPIKAFSSDGYFTCICYKNGFLYICDKENKQIIILDKILNKVENIKLDYEPLSIVVSDETICVSCLSMQLPQVRCNFTNLSFYDSKSFVLKAQHRARGNYIMMEINSFFYALNPKQMAIRSFSYDGIFMEIYNLDNIVKLEKAKCLLVFKEKILVVQSEVIGNSSVVYSF
jgi:hypothetical protein